MRYFDCNASYGRSPRPPHRFAATPGELIEQMDHCGIAAALVYHTNQRFASPATWNPVLVEETADEPRLVPAWVILPDACNELPSPEQWIEEMSNRGGGAVWAFPQEHRYRLDRDTFPQTFRLMAEQRIPLFAKENLCQLKELLKECPELIVVAANQGPHSLDRYLRPLMDAFPNLLVDTSYLLVEGLIEDLCGRYGPERLVFGTAYPDNCSGGALLRLARADIGEEARELIAASNLERLLAWGGNGRTLNGEGAPRKELSKVAVDYMANGRSDDCPIIDLHGHWGPYGGSYLPCASEDLMLAALRHAGVKRIVCSSHDALFGDTNRGNHDMQKAVARHPDILSAYWTVNPNYPDLAATASADFEHTCGFVGFKLLPDYHAYPIDGDRYQPSLEYANQRGLLVLVHTWGGSGFDSPQMFGEVAAKYPKAQFLMGHSGYGDWSAAVRVAYELPNVFLELTAVYAAHDFAIQPGGSGTPTPLNACLQVNGIIEYLVERAGSSKIVFGTDMPWYSPHYAAGTVLFARIDDQARHDILHRNAERLLDSLLEDTEQT